MKSAVSYSISLSAVCVFAAIVAACGSPPTPDAPTGNTTAPTPTSSQSAAAPPPSGSAASAETVAPHGPMLAVSATKMGDKLKAVGLDVKDLPTLENVPKAKLKDVMMIISEATGAKCGDCHEHKNFAAMTPRKKVAERMWNEWVRSTTMANGDPVFCDSCHHGGLTFLEHSSSLGKWMDANFVKGMTVTAKKASRKCQDCHGEPFNQYFLEDWKSASR
jgi:hypothetical protein